MTKASIRAIRYQKKQTKAGLCQKCPEPAWENEDGKKHRLCLRHIADERDSHAKRKWYKTQYVNCASRRAEAGK